MIGMLADETGFSAASILAMDGDDLTFWWNAVMNWRRSLKEES